MQRMALKSIYGLKVPYEKCLELSGLQRLDARREELLKDFARRAEQSERFGSSGFPRKQSSVYRLRREQKYIEEFAARDRLQNAPIFKMRKILNNVYFLFVNKFVIMK